MTRRPAMPALLIAVCLAAAGEPAFASGGETDERARWERAWAAHPDDADVAWGRARWLLETGQAADAAEAFESFRHRWPNDSRNTALQLGRARFEAGDNGAALEALTEAIARDGGDATAHLYRGLVLRRLGRHEEAERSLRFAARLDSALAGETLLLRGIGHLESGRRAEAEQLLQEAITRDPGSDTARRAERLLRTPEPPPTDRRLQLSAYAGFEYDSNVTLDGGTDLPGDARDRRDTAFLFGGGLSWQAIQGERSALTLGYRFDQSEHDDLEDFDVESHMFFASGSYVPRERVALRLDTFGTLAELDNARYLRSVAVRPNLFYEFGPRAGVLRVFGEAERRSYHEDPFLDSLDRSGWVMGGGLEHYLGVLASRGGWGIVGMRFARTDTNAGRDLFGLGPAFDHDLFQGSLRLHLPLWLGVEADASAGLGYERYDHRNAVDFLTDNGLGTLDPGERRDVVFDARIALTRALTRSTDLEISWRRTDRHSNVDLYRYDRDVFGVQLRLHSF